MKRRLRSLTTWSVAAGELGGRVDRGSRRASLRRPAAKSPGKANWLTDGGDNQRTAWQKNETRISTDSVKNMKLLWKLQLDNQPRQMHNLFPPLIVTDVTTAQGPKEIAVVAGVSDNIYGVDVATGTRLWSRKFDSTFVEQPGGRGGGVLCPGGLTATPVIAPDRHGGPLHRLRGVVGRTAAHARRGDRNRCRAAGAISSAERQALRAEPLEGRPLYDDGAGLRRQSQRVLRLRPGDEEGRSVPARQRRPVAALPARRLARTERSTRDPATATTIPNARSTGSRSSA